jgi:hypothetical protein
LDFLRRFFLSVSLAGLASASTMARAALGSADQRRSLVSPALLRRALDALDEQRNSMAYGDFIACRGVPEISCAASRRRHRQFSSRRAWTGFGPIAYRVAQALLQCGRLECEFGSGGASRALRSQSIHARLPRLRPDPGSRVKMRRAGSQPAAQGEARRRRKGEPPAGELYTMPAKGKNVLERELIP